MDIVVTSEETNVNESQVGLELVPRDAILLFSGCIYQQWFEGLDGLLGKHWRNVEIAFNCTFVLFGSVIEFIACARYSRGSKNRSKTCNLSKDLTQGRSE